MSSATDSKCTSSDCSNNDSQGQNFHILPHPAKSNDPADLQPRYQQKPESKPEDSPAGVLKSDAPIEAFHARDPFVPSEQIKKDLPPPLTHEELQARQVELNKN